MRKYFTKTDIRLENFSQNADLIVLFSKFYVRRSDSAIFPLRAKTSGFCGILAFRDIDEFLIQF